MEIMLIKKFRKTFSLIIAIGIVGVCLIIAIIAAVVLNSGLNAKTADLGKKLIAYKKTLGDNPEQIIADKQALAACLLDSNKKFDDLFKSTGFVLSTPLSFKQSLFKTQDDLKARALAKNMVFPVSLGFEEYKVKVPEPEITDVLTKELSVAEQIINAALDSGVSSIDNIKLGHQLVPFPSEEQKLKYIAVSLSIKSGSGQIKAFLMNIAKLPGIFAVKQLKITSIDQDKNLLSTDIELKIIEL